jgi:uncharacterized peroxidase-related enzyme
MNPRILPLSDELASESARGVFTQTERALGLVPNLHRTLAHSPAALRAYAETARHLAFGTLDPKLRERLAIATAADNGCVYCASAHTQLGRGAGLDADELERALRGTSSDPAAATALAFARKLVETRGRVLDADLAELRSAGFDEAAIVEIVAHVGMNTFTNLVNNLARTSVDFPRVEIPGGGR